MAPKGSKGGKRKRRGKKGNALNTAHQQVTYKKQNSNQMYARAVKMLGDCRIQCLCDDLVTRTGHIPGKFRKRVYINTDDILLVTTREFDPDKKNKTGTVDIIYKYTSNEANKLRKAKEISPKMCAEEAKTDLGQEDGGVYFHSVLDDLPPASTSVSDTDKDKTSTNTTNTNEVPKQPAFTVKQSDWLNELDAL